MHIPQHTHMISPLHVFINFSLLRDSSQSPLTVLPSLRTPAISKSRSRVAARVNSPVRPVTDTIPSKTVVPSSTENPVIEKASEMDENLEPLGVLDITNSSVRRSTRLTSKELKARKPGSENRFTQERFQPEVLNKPTQPPQQSQLEIVHIEEAQPRQKSSARPTRVTRSRAAKAITTSVDETDTNEPARRTTRASSKRLARTASKQIQKTLASDSDMDVVLNSPVNNVAPDSSLKSSDNKTSTNKSLPLQKNMSNLQVSLEKVASPSAVPPPCATPSKEDLPTINSPPSTSPEEELPPSASPHIVKPQSESSGQKQLDEVNEPQHIAEDKRPSEENVSVETSQLTVATSCNTDTGEDPVKACPPKKSLLMKLRKKGRGKGARKGVGRGRKGAAAATRKLTPIPIQEEKEGETC